MITTPTPHYTSQRAPGVVQSIYAHECIVERVAHALGMSHEDVQLKNFYQIGQTTPYGDHIGSSTYNWTLPTLWAKCINDSDFLNRHTPKLRPKPNPDPDPDPNHGIPDQESGMCYLQRLESLEKKGHLPDACKIRDAHHRLSQLRFGQSILGRWYRRGLGRRRRARARAQHKGGVRVGLRVGLWVGVRVGVMIRLMVRVRVGKA